MLLVINTAHKVTHKNIILGGVFVLTLAIIASFILILFQTMVQNIIMFTELIVLVKVSTNAVCLELLLP